MEIIYHDHHATVTDRTRDRAAAGAIECGRRLGLAVDAVIRFEHDGPLRRAEIILHAAPHRELVGKSAARSFDSAVTEALRKLERQVETRQRVDRARAQRARHDARA